MAAGEDALVTEVAGAVSEDEAFGHRSDAYLGRAVGLAYYILGDADEAEDATQEAMDGPGRHAARSGGSSPSMPGSTKSWSTRAGSGSAASGRSARSSRRTKASRSRVTRSRDFSHAIRSGGHSCRYRWTSAPWWSCATGGT